MSEPQSAIVTRGLTRRFGAITAVDDLDLDIKRGTIYGFLGPNGSGKTTAIRMLAGLLSPNAGDIRVLGLAIPRQAGKLRHRIGYMTQRFSLYEDLSVRENLAFIASIHTVPRDSVRHRIEELIDTYHLNEQRHQQAGTLSGGQRQRLALAAATLHYPELLFLDEPTSAVDPESRRDFWDKLFDLAEAGTTILVSTHYMDEAERCHELAILDRGRLAAQGKPRGMMDDIPARVVQVTTSRPRHAARRLKQAKSVIGVTQVGDLLRVQVDLAEDDPAGCVQRVLSGSGLEGDSREIPANLEDVFVTVTGRDRATDRQGEPA